MNRIVRYQGAIVREHKLLLIEHGEHAGGRSYWVIPGGELGPAGREHLHPFGTRKCWRDPITEPKLRRK